MSERGRYVVLEGGDAVGKSTVGLLLAHKIRDHFETDYITVEEPDGPRDSAGNQLVAISEELRIIIKNGELERNPQANVMMFNTSRGESWRQAMEPSVQLGKWVIGMRNYYSSVVYQGRGEGQDIAKILRKVRDATSPTYMNPDFAYILDVPEEVRLHRLAVRKGRTDLDTFEKKPTDFQIRVSEGYRWLSEEYGIPLIDAQPSPQEITDTIFDDIIRRLEEEKAGIPPTPPSFSLIDKVSADARVDSLAMRRWWPEG